MKTHELIYTLDTIESVVDELSLLMADCKVFTIAGPLGAGKTTLVQTLFRTKFDIQDEIQSPTFTYMQEYGNAMGQTLYHFDLYRLKNLHEFTMAGFHEYLYLPNSWVFIEWPEIIMPLVQKQACHLVIDYHGQDRRRLRYEITQ